LSKIPVGTVVQVLQISEEDLHLDVAAEHISTQSVPLEIQDLLHKYAGVFASKVEYPPPRSCNHSIPLIPGARPVYVRPYMYAPVLKTEIENQVQAMLKDGLI
jgi:hypothetical protein